MADTAAITVGATSTTTAVSKLIKSNFNYCPRALFANANAPFPAFPLSPISPFYTFPISHMPPLPTISFGPLPFRLITCILYAPKVGYTFQSLLCPPHEHCSPNAESFPRKRVHTVRAHTRHPLPKQNNYWPEKNNWEPDQVKLRELKCNTARRIDFPAIFEGSFRKINQY